MGDLVDITTIRRQKNIFFRISSGSLRFQIKGAGNAGIGIAKSPYETEFLWFVLGRDGYTTVTKNRVQCQSVPTPGILSAREFREFWLQWHGNMLCLGRDYAEHPFIVHEESTVDLQYVTFGVYGNDECSLRWRFEMPPLLEQIRIKPVSNGVLQWVSAENQLPDGALIGGFEREALYVIRARHQGSLTPGKFVPSQGLGYIPWGGGMHEKSDLEVLCGYDCMWLPCSNGTVPTGSVEAGYSEGSNHEVLYVGRAVYDNHLIPGKVQPSHHVCYIPYNDREIPRQEYEILVVPHKNVQVANPFFVYNHAIRLD